MIKVSLIQFDVVALKPKHNVQRIVSFIENEARQGAQLIVFPELSNTGYVEPLVPGGPFVSDVVHYPSSLYQACADMQGDDIQAMIDAAHRTNVHVVVGLGVRDPVQPGVMRNCSLLINGDGVVGRYSKIHQWHNEKLYFTKGSQIEAFSTLGANIGMQICYDIRFPEITRIYSLQGADIITSVWASFGEEGLPVPDEDLFVHRAYARAIENGVFVLSCNRSGSHGNQRFFGRSCALAPDGRVLGRLDHDREDVLRVIVDLTEVVRYRTATGIWLDRVPALYDRYLKT